MDTYNFEQILKCDVASERVSFGLISYEADCTRIQQSNYKFKYVCC